MEKVFNAETLTVKGWEGFTTQQIGDALEKAIAEKEKMVFRVKKIVCGNAIIDLPSTRGKVTEAYLWPKLLERFSGNPAEKHLITVEVEDESL